MDSEDISCNWEWKTEGSEPWLGDMIKHIYGPGESQPVGVHGYLLLDSLTLDNLEEYIDKELKKVSSACPVVSEDRGIVGPEKVIFDVTTNVGSLVIDRDRLGLSSQSNFSSIRANCCVYKGKWQYELMLNSKGVMQVGWATLTCRFSQEKGVGDTKDSYAYDGNRVRKWNVSTYKYGEPWLMGDVIGCTIDLDEGVVSFYRNGRFLGEAFSNIRVGPGLAYFPAVSLAYNENLVANFGTTPMRYPVEGFLPLQQTPMDDVLKTNKLLSWLKKVIQLYPSAVKEEQNMTAPLVLVKGWAPKMKHGFKAQLLLLAAPLMHRLGPLLASPFVTEASLLPILSELLNEMEHDTEIRISYLLDLMWSLMEPHELHPCLEYLVLALLTGYRFSPASSTFYPQKCYLRLTLSVLKHTATRHYLLKHILFDKIKFPILMEVKPLDGNVLTEVIPDVWLDMGQELTDEEIRRKSQYGKSCSQLKAAVQEVEEIQLEILIQLFNGSDLIKGQCSQSIFLSKFRDFLRENSGGTRVPTVHLCPLPVALAFYHRLISLLSYYSTLYGYNIHTMLCVPSYIFSTNSDDCLEIQRIGGLQSHLLKTFHKELVELGNYANSVYESHNVEASGKSTRREAVRPKVMQEHAVSSTKPNFPDVVPNAVVESHGPQASNFEVPKVSAKPAIKPIEHPKSQAVSEPKHDSFVKAFTSNNPLDVSAQNSKNSRAIVDLMDGIIRLYHIAAHRQLEKMCALRESMQEYTTALQDIEKLMAEHGDHIQELKQAKQVFINKLVEQSRHLAWIVCVIYSSEKQADVYWMLQVLLRSLAHMSDAGLVFSFVPDFYVEACIKCANALRTFFHPLSDIEKLPNYQDTLVKYGKFLACHFADSRVVNAELKDSLVQALASYVIFPSTLQALEKIDTDSRIQMTEALLQPYENRAWAQSNWILIRLWKGCGFAFRYSVPPHLAKKSCFKSSTVTDVTSTKPCPSPTFLGHLGDWLLNNNEGSTGFIGSILNQLNWSFSEFIGMVQEIQNASNRPERVFIDSRQLKICATCFDLTLGLLRVIEMIANLVPQLFTDWSRSSAEIFLTRLCQLLCQVLNRVTSISGCFCLVVNMEIPGLEVVDHFPILSAVTGILVSLIMEGKQPSRECAISALLSEPSFEPKSLDFLLGNSKDAKNSKGFSFRDYDDVSYLEVKDVEALIDLLHARYQLAQQNRQSLDIDDDSICTICYASSKTALFFPCQHQSCRSCISVHLLQHKECFFCKTEIEKVQSTTTGETIFSGSKT